MSSIVSGLGVKQEKKLRETYGQIFNLIDKDKSGTLDNDEIDEWFGMVGAEIELNELKQGLLGHESESFHLEFTRERFIDFMCKKTKHNSRNY